MAPLIGSETHSHFMPPTDPIAGTPVWYVVNHVPFGDFTESIEDMLRSYLYDNWGNPVSIIPEKSTNAPSDLSSKVKFGDYQYDYFSTYYIRIKESDTEFDNELMMNSGSFQMKTFVNIDLTARRLKYGEHFEELNNMRLEVIRILGNYKPDSISGIYNIEIDRPGERDIETRNFETAGRAPKTIWYLRIAAVCYYIKGFHCVV
jgi:hypothetical protein